MGFWSKLGNILKVAGSVAAIPLTGGASAAAIPAWLAPTLGAAGAVGGALGSMGEGRAAGRAAEAGLVGQQNQDAYQRALLELQQKQYGLDAPQSRATNAVRGDILKNLQDVSITAPGRVAGHVGTITGGLRPSLLSDETRALGGDMTRQALMQQLQGDTFAPMNTATYPQSGKLDTVLNTAGAVGGLADVLGGLMKKQPSPIALPSAGSPWDNAAPPPVTVPPVPQAPTLPAWAQTSARPYRNLFGG